METLIVVNNPEKWLLNIPNTRVISPRHYITDAEFVHMGKFKVFNLCNAFKYQNMGYYVSLLAKARMHQPEPSVRTIMDFGSRKMFEGLASDIEDLVNRVLAKYPQKKFKIDVFFGKCANMEFDRLARALFARFQAPMFRAKFKRGKLRWKLEDLEPFSSRDIDDANRDLVAQAAADYVTRRHKLLDWRDNSRYAIAILVDTAEEYQSSNKKALARFARAAQKVGFYCEFITKDDFDRINEFDALFIRSTTNVNNYTYRFSRMAYAEGLVVVDDPSSIVRCANKVFQAEQANLLKVATPKTVIVHKGNCRDFCEKIGFPLVVKQPDSQFSQGVFKADNKEELTKIVDRLMKGSDLLIAQEFVPTKFDWRIGIFNKKPIFACKYYMAKSHWQIVNSKAKGNNRCGTFETLHVQDAPKKVVDLALRMANAIGDGLYGVDVKETDDGRIVLMEVNDNPNVDAGIEDKVLGQALYVEIMQGFMDRVNKIKKLKPVPEQKLKSAREISKDSNAAFAL